MTPSATSCCLSTHRPMQNWATLVRSRQSMQLVRITPRCRNRWTASAHPGVATPLCTGRGDAPPAPLPAALGRASGVRLVGWHESSSLRSAQKRGTGAAPCAGTSWACRRDEARPAKDAQEEAAEVPGETQPPESRQLAGERAGGEGAAGG
eukprot:scaffold21707_cov67-Isochrysis_galbana.AAC.3